MKRFLNWKFGLTLIVIISAILRFYVLDKIPGTLNPDEAALGYTSFSLLKSGIDEHGTFLPIALESFGDWKQSGYAYLSIISIAIFGNTAFGIRFLSSLSGVIAVLLIFYIVNLLFKRKSLALIASLFYAISPWNIFFSRTAYEVNFANTLFLGGLYLFLKYLSEKREGRNKDTLATLSSILFVSAAFVQNNYILFTPIFVLCLTYIYRRKINWNKRLIIPAIVFVFFSTVSILSSFFLSINKTNNLLVFNNKNIIYERSDKLKGDKARKNPLVEKLIYNKFTAGFYQLGENYINVFTPSFYFDKGGEKLVDSLGYFGHFYLIDALFIIVGLISLLIKNVKERSLLFLWLILAPIPSALTYNPLTATRLYTLLPLFIILSSYGAYEIFMVLKAKTIRNYFMKTALVLLFTYNIILFIDGYFVHFNYQRIRFWKYGFEQAVTISQKYPDYKIVVRGPDNFPYIYFLFYNKYDPKKFVNEVTYYPTTKEGFKFVKSFDKYSFPWNINYKNLRPRTIYIDDANVEKRTYKILLPSGEPILGYEIIN